MAISATFGTQTTNDYGILASAKFVRGDTAPQIKLTLTKSDDTPQDLSGCTVNLLVRKAGTTVLLYTRPLVIPTSTAAQGVAYVVWEAGDLDYEAGLYEGEIEIIYSNGKRETLFDVLQLTIREDFN